MDFIGPVDGVHILVKVHYFSTKIQLEVCGSADADHVVRGLNRWVELRRTIRIIIVD